MMTLLSISFALFIAYTITACIDSVLTTNGNMPPSLSDTFYLLELHKEGMGYIFTATMLWCIAFIVVPWIEATPDQFQVFPFLGVAGLGFVATAPFFKDNKTYREVHVAGAVIAALMAAVWGIFIMGQWEVWLIVSILILMAAIGTGSALYAKTFWLEMISFIATYMILFDYYL